MLALLFLTGCSPRQVSHRITVRGEPSLDGVFADIAQAYTKKYADAQVVSKFSCPPCVLYRKEGQHPELDVFVSLGDFETELLRKHGKLRFRDLTTVGRVPMSLVVPQRMADKVHTLSDLHTAVVAKIGVGDPDNAAVGYYAKQGLDKAGVWTELKSRFVHKRSGCEIAKLVGLGRDLDAAIVFSVCAGEEGGKVREVLQFSEDLIPPVPLLVGIATDTQNPEESRRFLEFVASPEARLLLKQHRVLPPTAKTR
jgi:molybdate transport system substrate-binding protein